VQESVGAAGGVTMGMAAAGLGLGVGVRSLQSLSVGIITSLGGDDCVPGIVSVQGIAGEVATMAPT
jgi:hypothetical protein